MVCLVVAKSKGNMKQDFTLYCSRQSNMSVVLAVFASYSRCFVRMLPVNWLLTSSSVSVWANISSKSVAVDKSLRGNIGLRCDAAFSHFQTDIAYYYLFGSLPVFKRQIRKQANVALHSLYRMVYLFLFQEEKWIRYSRKTKRVVSTPLVGETWHPWSLGTLDPSVILP